MGTAWGDARYTWGSTPTDYTYTGQYSNVPEFGLYYYNARWYDGQLGRFTQADTIIPLESQGVQAWDRYAGMNNNPVRYNDPSGHCPTCLVGLVGGAVVGVAIVYFTHPNLTPRDYMQAAFVGATAGLLIGSGVGAGAGTAIGATLFGAGVGAATSAAAYSVTAGESYNSQEMTGNALIGMATGAAVALTGPAVLEAKVASSFTAQAARAGINALGAQASIALNDQFDDDLSPTGGMDFGSAAVGGYGFGFTAELADTVVTTVSGSKTAGTVTYNLARSLSIATVQNHWLNWVDSLGEIPHKNKQNRQELR